MSNWFNNNAKKYCDPEVLENLQKKKKKGRSKSKTQELLPGTSYTGRRLAKILYADLFEEGKQQARQQGTENLQIFRPAESYMWDKLTEEQQTQCIEWADDLNHGRFVNKELQRQ